MNDLRPNVPSMTNKEANTKLQSDKSFILLDVREDNEYEFVHIDRATHIKMKEVPQRIAELPKDKEIGVMCLGGGRSAQITNYLLQQGFTSVKNIEGGISRWAVDIDTSLPRYRLMAGQIQKL